MHFRNLILAALLGWSGAALAASPLPADWKALYQSGRLETPYRHYAVIMNGVAGRKAADFGAKPGPAFMGMKIWASSSAEAAQMARSYAERASFTIRGEIEVYATDPTEPPRDEPYAYSVKVTSYKK